MSGKSWWNGLVCLFGVIGCWNSARGDEIPQRFSRIFGEQLVSHESTTGGSAASPGCADSRECVIPLGEERYSDQKLFGLIAQSDKSFTDFISPITNPVFFEDPRTLTEIRPIFIHHNVPRSAGGGSVQLFAMQIRAALTDRLSIIATKDGFITSSNPLIDDGWADVAAGLKYNLIRNTQERYLVSTGMVYEIPAGSTRALQGNGGGEFNLFLTAAAEIMPKWHWVSASGFRLPANSNQESQLWYWSNHLDHEIFEGVYGLVEMNWYHWMKSGGGGIPGVEGIDLFNFGSTGVAGLDVVTLAFGMKFKPADNMEIGIAYEFPVTGRKFIMENRLTVDWIIRF